MAVNWNLLQGGGPASKSLQSALGGYQAGTAVRQQQEEEQQDQELDQVSMRLEQKMRDPTFELDSSPLFGQLMAERPEVAEAYATRHASMQGRQLESYVQDMTAVRSALQRGDQNGAYNILGDRIEMLESQGRDDTDSVRMLRILEEQGPEAALMGLDQMVAAQQGQYTPMQSKGRKPYQKADGGFVFNPNTGEYTVDEDYRAALLSEKEQDGGLDVSTKRGLSKDISGMTEQTNQIVGTAKDLRSLSKNAKGSDYVAAIFKFMKSLDPNSVVREGEFATAENISGVPTRIKNLYNKAISGEGLSEKDYGDMIRTAETLANNSISSARENVQGYMAGFGDDIPQSFAKSQLNRIPKRFEISEVSEEPEPAPEDDQTGSGVTGEMRKNAQGGGNVGRFKIIEVN